jgi:ATP-binding protein involved in chromosome partitioning
VPILGIVENMSGFTCPDCGSGHDIFDTGGAGELGAEFDVPVLGQVPLDPALGQVSASKDEDSEPPGVSIPGLGRLQLPQLRGEREQADSLDPIAIREDGGDTRGAVELLATRTAARINSLNVSDARRHNNDPSS